jgi:mono/diheme cytochrome c family protein
MLNKILKFLGVALLIVIIAASGLLAYVKIALPNVGAAPDLKVEITPEKVERGKYLANHVMVCMDCHGTRDWTKFSGPMIEENAGRGGEVFNQQFGFPGNFIAKNITPFNLKNWTDGEIFRAITCGINKDGKAFFPVMPYKYYAQTDAEDIEAVIAYLRTIPEINATHAESVADFPFNFILNTIPEKANLQKRPAKTDVVAYGKYMTTASGCMECHTKQEKGKVTGEFYAGGFEFNFGNGTLLRSPNITPHETGIGNWNKQQFIQRFKMYADSTYVLPAVDMNKGEFQTVMPWTMYAGMTEEDLGAIFEYLKTVKPVNNTVVRFVALSK